MASNIPRLAVTALSERLRVVGFTGVDVWSDWVRNDLDQTSGIAHREALALGKSYVIVWADEQGRAKVSVESARQVATLVDPSTRRIVAAVKRWETTTTTEAVVYEADVITRYRANLGATTAGYRAVSTVANPLGVVPVVALTNGDRLLDDGVSELTDLVPLVDALNKSLCDMLVTSEYSARPRRCHRHRARRRGRPRPGHRPAHRGPPRPTPSPTGRWSARTRRPSLGSCRLRTWAPTRRRCGCCSRG